jgi:hypothetical protein
MMMAIPLLCTILLAHYQALDTVLISICLNIHFHSSQSQAVELKRTKMDPSMHGTTKAVIPVQHQQAGGAGMHRNQLPVSRTVRLVNREPPKMSLQSLPGKLLRVNAEG